MGKEDMVNAETKKKIFYMKISHEFTFTKAKVQYVVLRCETVGI